LNSQRGNSRNTLSCMQLQRIKTVAAALWMLTVIVIATAVEVSWTTGIALAAFGLLPPLALLLLWNEPRQTMSESIRDARR
jgi:hypothetical protein